MLKMEEENKWCKYMIWVGSAVEEGCCPMASPGTGGSIANMQL